MWRRSIVVCERPAIAVSITEWSRRGLPCVLVHGLGDAGCVWNPLAMRLMVDFRVVALDLRGHGDSHWDPEHRYGTEVLASDLEKTIGLFGFHKAVVVGHSLGAAIAIHYAAENPDRVAGLVVVDFGPELDETGVNEVMRVLAEAPRNFGSAEQYAAWLIERRPLADPHQLRELARGMLRQSPAGCWEHKIDPALLTASQISRLQRARGRYHYPELWTALERIECPTLVIRGMASGILPHDVAARMAERTLKSGRLVTISGAGHSVMLDNSAEFSGRVAEFMAGVAAQM